MKTKPLNMKIHDVRQGSIDWLKLHIGVATASALGQLVTPDMKMRTGAMPRSYLYRKAAETWRGEPLLGFSTFDVEQGTIIEDKARPLFELNTGLTTREVGFITNDDKNFGCSPDGIIGDDCGLEIKCPQPQTHVKYLLEGILPDEHAPQVFGGMYATGFSKWIFTSYRVNFPLFVLEINRDETYMERIDKAVKDFAEKLKKAHERLAFIEDNS
jgi:hypothetical protein